MPAYYRRHQKVPKMGKWLGLTAGAGRGGGGPAGDCIVIGYHGLEPALQGKVLRLAKEPAIRRQRDTFTGHPATAYNDFVATMLTDYIGVPPSVPAGWGEAELCSAFKPQGKDRLVQIYEGLHECFFWPQISLLGER